MCKQCPSARRPWGELLRVGACLELGGFAGARERRWWSGTEWPLTCRPIAGRAPALGGGIPGCEAAASGPMCFFVY